MALTSVARIGRLSGTLGYTAPPPRDEADEKVVSGIRSAWDDHSVVDGAGQIWVSRAKLHVILRTTVQNARLFADHVPDTDRRQDDGTEWVRGWQVAMKLDQEIQTTGMIARVQYLIDSEGHYHAIRDAADAVLLRVRTEQGRLSLARTLKKRRIKSLGITQDELTGEALDLRTAHFAHVLARAAFRHFVDCVWNGVVVNAATHEALTDNGVSDDVELLAFCEERSLSTGWLAPFRDALRQATTAAR